jgi:uncharacterized membrane protein
MSKDKFLEELRRGLTGLPPQEVEEIVGDYAAHFAESAARNRNEAEVIAALGDPARIARELRADIGLRRFEDNWTLSNLFAATMSLAGLAIVDLLLLLPLLILTVLLAAGLAIGLVGVGAVGLKIIVTALLFQPMEALTDFLGRLCIGVGLVCALIGGGALLLMGLGAGIRALGHYARLHFRLSQLGRQEV